MGWLCSAEGQACGMNPAASHDLGLEPGVLSHHGLQDMSVPASASVPRPYPRLLSPRQLGETTRHFHTAMGADLFSKLSSTGMTFTF